MEKRVTKTIEHLILLGFLLNGATIFIELIVSSRIMISLIVVFTFYSFPTIDVKAEENDYADLLIKHYRQGYDGPNDVNGDMIGHPYAFNSLFLIISVIDFTPINGLGYYSADCKLESGNYGRSTIRKKTLN